MKTWRAELGRDDPIIDMAVRWLLDVGEFVEMPEAARFVARLVATLVGWPSKARIIDDGEGRWVESTAKAYEGEVELKPWGTVDVIAECDRMGLYRLNLFPSATLPDHAHYVMRESELIIGHGLVGWSSGGRPHPLRAGERREWAHGTTHGYHNPSFEVASLLCIDRPRFMPEDEVETGRRIDLSGV